MIKKAISISTTKELLKLLKQKSKLRRLGFGKVKRTLYSDSEFNALTGNISVSRHTEALRPREVLFHEAGHRFTRPKLDIRSPLKAFRELQRIRKTENPEVSLGLAMLERERIANEWALKFLKEHGEASRSLKDYAQGVTRAYNTYKSNFIFDMGGVGPYSRVKEIYKQYPDLKKRPWEP